MLLISRYDIGGAGGVRRRLLLLCPTADWHCRSNYTQSSTATKPLQVAGWAEEIFLEANNMMIYSTGAQYIGSL